MKTIEIKLFSINELSQQAKENAHEQYVANLSEYFWMDEYIETIKKGCEAFNFELKNYSFDFECPARSNWRIINNNENAEDLTGMRLRTYILNNFYSVFYQRKPQGKYEKRGDKWEYKRRSKIQFIETGCPFTGYCGDCNFLAPFISFIDKPNNSTLKELIEDAINAVLKAGEADIEHQRSFEYFIEHAEANNYEFEEDGGIY